MKRSRSYMAILPGATIKEKIGARSYLCVDDCIAFLTRSSFSLSI